MSSPIELLEKLVTLFEAGHLSEEEFQKAKVVCGGREKGANVSYASMLEGIEE